MLMIIEIELLFFWGDDNCSNIYSLKLVVHFSQMWPRRVVVVVVGGGGICTRNSSIFIDF